MTLLAVLPRLRTNNPKGIGATLTLDLAVEALDRIGRVQLGSMLLRECHVGEHIGLCLVQESRKLLLERVSENCPASAEISR